jgi:hypothetical protein
VAGAAEAEGRCDPRLSRDRPAYHPAVRGESGTRDLAIAVAVVIALSRFAPDVFVWPIAVVLLAGVALGALQVVAEADPAAEQVGVPVESLILPGAAALAGLGVIRLVPIGLALVPAFAFAGGLVGIALVTELRLARATGPPSRTDRTAVLIQVLVVGFLGFAGVAALVPGGLPVPGADPAVAPDRSALVILAIADAAIGFLLGYRVAALRSSRLRDVAWFAATTAAVVAIAAIALRSIEIPKILGPALLVLVFFLWDAIHTGGAPRRRDPVRVWETALLAVLAVVVVGWTLSVRV